MSRQDAKGATSLSWRDPDEGLREMLRVSSQMGDCYTAVVVKTGYFPQFTKGITPVFTQSRV